jgi:hypothetical protein
MVGGYLDTSCLADDKSPVSRGALTPARQLPLLKEFELIRNPGQGREPCQELGEK